MAKKGGPFVWAGQFDILPATNAQLVKMLGVDGSVSPDIGIESHLWLTGTPAVVDDIGTLEDNTFDMSVTTSPPVSDSDFLEGLQDVTEFSIGDGASTPGSFTEVPNPSDYTKSLIVGFVGRVDATTPGGTARKSLYWKTSTSGGLHGWELYVPRDTESVVFAFHETSASRFLGAAVPIVFGEPFAVFCNLDFDTGKMKIITSVPGSFATTEPNFSGAWLQNVQLRMGVFSTISDGWAGIWARGFTLQYSAALDAEFGEANMVNFLKFADGTLTL